MSCQRRTILAALGAAGSLTVLVSPAQAAPVSQSHQARLPKITASVKVLSPTARLVHIVNNDNVPGYFFVAHSTDSPKILSATSPSGPCKIVKVVFFTITKHTEYRAHCKVTLAPGKAVNVRLQTTRGNGTVAVLVCPTKTFCFLR